MSFSVKSKNPHGYGILQNVQKDGTRAYSHNVFSTFSEWAFCTLGPFCGIVSSAKKGKIFLFSSTAIIPVKSCSTAPYFTSNFTKRYEHTAETKTGGK